MKRICTICARSGSTRLKNKNIYPINGIPLLAYSIAVARASKMIDQIVVTSDSEQYLEIGKKWGADQTIKRPAQLASSKISKTVSIAHAVTETEKIVGYSFNSIIDLDVTAPLRRVSDVTQAIRLLEQNEENALISVVESKSTPFSNMFFMDDKGYLKPIVKPEKLTEHTGSAKTCYTLNASIYAWQREIFISNPTTIFPETKLYIMPQLTRYDIDTIEDIQYLEYIIEKNLFDIIKPSL